MECILWQNLWGCIIHSGPCPFHCLVQRQWWIMMKGREEQNLHECLWIGSYRVSSLGLGGVCPRCWGFSSRQLSLHWETLKSPPDTLNLFGKTLLNCNNHKRNTSRRSGHFGSGSNRHSSLTVERGSSQQSLSPCELVPASRLLCLPIKISAHEEHSGSLDCVYFLSSPLEGPP